MSTTIITNFRRFIKTVSKQIADCLQTHFLELETVGGENVSYSLVIESGGFSVKNNENITVDTFAFGEAVTSVNRFEPSILEGVFADDSSGSADKVSALLMAAGYGSVLSFYLTQQVLREYRYCLEDPEREGSLQEEFGEALGYISCRARVLCCLLSDSLVKCSKERGEIIEPLLRSVKLPCSFLYEGDSIKIAYSIPDLDSLLILDCLYCHQNGIHMNECENCGRFFIPTTRSDEKYCPYRDASGRECRKIGYENKLKTSPLDALYRKIYKTQNSRKNRNSQNVKDIEKLFRRWSAYAADLKRQCENGEISTEQFEKLASDPSWMKTKKSPGGKAEGAV